MNGNRLVGGGALVRVCVPGVAFLCSCVLGGGALVLGRRAKFVNFVCETRTFAS